MVTRPILSLVLVFRLLLRLACIAAFYTFSYAFPFPFLFFFALWLFMFYLCHHYCRVRMLQNWVWRMANFLGVCWRRETTQKAMDMVTYFAPVSRRGWRGEKGCMVWYSIVLARRDGTCVLGELGGGRCCFCSSCLPLYRFSICVGLGWVAIIITIITIIIHQQQQRHCRAFLVF
jgi:hypothetical protein